MKRKEKIIANKIILMITMEIIQHQKQHKQTKCLQKFEQ